MAVIEPTLQATVRPSIQGPWLSIAPVDIGRDERLVANVAAFVTVERDGEPFMRLDIYEIQPEARVFAEATIWSGFVVVGFGERAHFVSLADRTVVTLQLNGYFGHLYPTADRLLIADARGLVCVDRRGAAAWARDDLAIDGVLVSAVEDGVVIGDGEWNPPGDWRSFRVRLSSGERVDVAPEEPR
jgi:hypothetical protein